MSSIEIPIPPDECPLCNSIYENIGHPRTGAVMMRDCKCKITTEQTDYGTIVVFTPPEESDK